jgi:predicted ATP-binding protein involved in virulence
MTISYSTNESVIIQKSNKIKSYEEEKLDKPEIFLHVDWQRQFIEDILKIAKLGDHTFLIATHSTQIIGSRRDLAVALDGGILCD